MPTCRRVDVSEFLIAMVDITNVQNVIKLLKFDPTNCKLSDTFIPFFDSDIYILYTSLRMYYACVLNLQTK